MQELELDLDLNVTTYQPPRESIACYREHGFDGDDGMAAEMLADASTFNGAVSQGWKFRLLQGEILTKWKERTPGFFEKWLKLHWPEMGRTTVYRLMTTWQHRHQLTPFTEEDDDVSREKHPLSIQAIDTIALGGAMPEVIEQVRDLLEQGMAVAPQVVADLNRESKAKRKGVSAPRKPQPAEALALSILRKGEIDRLREALALAERCSVVTTAELKQELPLLEIPKVQRLAGTTANFHRMKDGSWIRIPHAGDIDVTPEPPAAIDPEPQQQLMVMESAESADCVVSLDEAAKRIGVKRSSLSCQLVPSMNPNGITRGGFLITRAGRGMVRLTPVAP